MKLVQKRLLPLFSMMAVLAVVGAFAVAVPAANAEGWNANNPAYTWTTGTGQNYYYYSEAAVVSSGPADICVSPVQWNGSKWVFPWGWQCKNYEVAFTHSYIEAGHGVYNPNGSRQYFNAYFYG